MFISVYLINAIDLAKEMLVWASAPTPFFSRHSFASCKGSSEEDALQHMSDAATHSYLKKGQNVADMNHKASMLVPPHSRRLRFPLI